jgi:hypothetical protein
MEVENGEWAGQWAELGWAASGLEVEVEDWLTI